MKKNMLQRRAILQLFCSVVFAAGVPFTVVQAHEAHVGELYRCADGQTALKVTQCSSGNPALCDIELYRNGVAQPGVRLPKSNVNELVGLCLGTAAARPAEPSAQAGASPVSQGPDANGFKIGESVNAATAGGWYTATILRANGNSYFVHFGSSIEVWKTYPTELRRIGPLTEVDKAHGLFALHEKVQVNVEGGGWVDGEVITEMGMEYQVALSGNRTAWAIAQQMRRVAVPAKPAPPAPGQPPHAGLTSCAGKIEGRYASSEFGNFTIVFRSGKAVMKMYGQSEDELECWMSGEKKIILHKPGTEEDLPIEINDDGTLDTPAGEIKKKSS